MTAAAPARRPRRRRDGTDDAEYVAMMRRMMRALGPRGGADPETLVGIAAIAAEADAILNAAIVRCHETGTDGAGYSYAEIADRLGVTRQAVHQRVTRYKAAQGEA